MPVMFQPEDLEWKHLRNVRFKAKRKYLEVWRKKHDKAPPEEEGWCVSVGRPIGEANSF